ncbi:MAG: hypothetical protein ABIH23_15155 [bacterium]
MKKIKGIIVTILATLIVIVILQNIQSVETRILFINITMPRALLLIVTLFVGFGLGVLASDKILRRNKKT